MKLPNTIYVLTIIWFILGFMTPILWGFKRPLAPNLPVFRNEEFNTSGGGWRHRDLYKIVLKYCNNVKPNDTILTYYSHYPTHKDISIQGWFNETYSFYAPDNQEAIEYMFICDLEVIQYWTTIDEIY